MINKLTKIAVILMGIVFLTISCKKDSDGNSGPQDDEEGINQSIVSDKLNSVETEKPPRSEKVETEITDENEIFSTPDDVYDEATGESQSKVELLINGATSNTSAKLAKEENAAFAWILSSKNGTAVDKNSKYLFIFTLSGKYLRYNNSDNAAQWGYYYLDSLVTKVGFDYKNGVFENKFRIEELTSSALVVTFKGDKLGFKPYQMKGVPSNAFTPKKNTSPTTPTDTTSTEPGDTASVTAPEFLKIVDAETIGNIDYFTIEGDVAGDTNSNFLDKLTISYATVNDTTPINISLIAARNFVSDTDTSTNPITLGGTDKNKFSGKIEIDNTQFPTPRSFTFRLQSDLTYNSVSYKFGSDSN